MLDQCTVKSLLCIPQTHCCCSGDVYRGTCGPGSATPVCLYSCVFACERACVYFQLNIIVNISRANSRPEAERMLALTYRALLCCIRVYYKFTYLQDRVLCQYIAGLVLKVLVLVSV